MTNHFNNGVLLIAAAGNDGNNTHSYPASYDAVMSVASVDSNKNHSAFSQYTNQVEISGPGEAILSTVTRGEGRLADIVIAGQSLFAEGGASQPLCTIGKQLCALAHQRQCQRRTGRV